MADTTTTLNPGTGGDIMDESSVTQSPDGATQTSAKRPRVVLGHDDGKLVNSDRPLHVQFAEMLAEQRRTNALLAIIAGELLNADPRELADAASDFAE